MTAASLPAPVVPFAARPTPDVRPDLWPLGRQPPDHVDDPGPRTLVRLDRETPALVAAKLARLAADPDPWTAEAAGADGGQLTAAGRRLAAAVAADHPGLLCVDDDGLRLPGTGVAVDHRGDLRRTSADPLAPVATDPDRVLTRLRAVDPTRRALEATALAIGEDVVVVDRDAHAVWLHVCAPSGWDPGGAGGAPLAALHGPVPAADRLRTASAALGRTITAGGPHVRWTWGLTPDRALARHSRRLPDEPAPGPPIGELTFRAERQTTLPLPELGLGIFTIRVHRAPLAAVVGGDALRCAALAAAVASLPDALATYKGVAARRDELLAWLAPGGSR